MRHPFAKVHSANDFTQLDVCIVCQGKNPNTSDDRTTTKTDLRL